MPPSISNPDELVAMFHPAKQSEVYDQYFRWFLASTDQKDAARQWFQTFLGTIEQRDTCIDVGAGRGDMVPVLSPFFRRCIAVEPGREMAKTLTRAHPNIELYTADILTAPLPPQSADFAVESHVKYYIPVCDWEKHTDRILSWLVPGGLFVDVMQNPFSDFQKMISSFLGPEHAYNMQDWAFEYAARKDLNLQIDCRECWVEEDSLERMLGATIFMMNHVPPKTLAEHPNRPTRQQLADWIHHNHRSANGTYRMSCRQDFAVYVVP